MCCVRAVLADGKYFVKSGSWATSSAVRAVMQGNRSTGTKPELALRSALHRAGLRFRVARRPLLGNRWSADIVFGAVKLAVFVDGCYWHGCPHHGTAPRTNPAYWEWKIARNRARDASV